MSTSTHYIVRVGEFEFVSLINESEADGTIPVELTSDSRKAWWFLTRRLADRVAEQFCGSGHVETVEETVAKKKNGDIEVNTAPCPNGRRYIRVAPHNEALDYGVVTVYDSADVAVVGLTKRQAELLVDALREQFKL